MKLKAYGSQGSIPFFSREKLRSGGNTSCFGLEIDGHNIILDCGTGIMQFHSDMLKEKAALPEKRGLAFDILISHLHLDHIIGLSMFDFLFDKANKIRIYTRSRNEQPVASQVFGIFKPPYWPICLEKMSRAEIIEITGNETLSLSENVKVKTFDSMHDNDTTAFRIEDMKSGKAAVYLLDYEITEEAENLQALAEFCKNADVVVFDATYLPEDYPARKGWGHSTYEAGMLLAQMCGCKRMVFSHFCHIYSDDVLDSLIHRVNGKNEGGTEYLMAYDGMELEI